MARFDKNAPFEMVGGAPGAAYIQNGHYFNNGYQEVEIIYEGEGDQRRPLGRVKVNAGPPLTIDELDEAANSTDKPIDPSQMHWRHLKSLVESYGGVWTNRSEAMTFLAGQSKDEEAA